MVKQNLNQKFKKDGEGDNVSYRPISDDEVEKIKQKQGDMTR